MNTKKEIRKTILKKRDALTATEHKQKSNFISEQIIHMPEFQESDMFLLFASYKSEVDTEEIINVDMIKVIIYLAIVIYIITFITFYFMNLKQFQKGVNVD